MLDFLGEPMVVFAIGLGGGLMLGLAARLGRFCTLGMIEDAHFGQDLSRAWMWLLALGTAMMAGFAAEAAGLVDLGQTVLMSNRFPVAGAILGGLAFGYGMALAGNCGFGLLARLGGGDLRALVVALIMGVAGFAALSGIFATIRAGLFPILPASAPNGLFHVAADVSGLAAPVLGITCGLAMAAFAAIRLLRAGARKMLVYGVLAGVAISSGFLGTYWVANTGFGTWPVISHSFTQPIGDTIRYVMFASVVDPGFGLGSVLGVVLGGTLGSLIKDGFRWEACEDHRELRRQMAGGALMGIGAVLAAGCSVGQGLSALSIAAVNAPLVAVSIWLGAWLGLRKLILGAHAVFGTE